MEIAELGGKLGAGEGEDVVGEQPLGELERVAGLAQLALGVGPEIALGGLGRRLAQGTGVEEDAAVAQRPVGEVVAALELVHELRGIVAVEVDLGGQVAEIGPGADHVVVEGTRRSCSSLAAAVRFQCFTTLGFGLIEGQW